MKGTRYFLDMDGTLAVWQTGKEDELLQKGYFRNLPPTEFVPPFREFAKQHADQVYILSHCLTEGYADEDKRGWLDEYFPEISEEHRLLLPCGVCKADFVMDLFHLDHIPGNWVLFDDYSKNLHAWKAAGGTGLKCYNGINGNHGTWKGASAMWSRDITEFIKKDKEEKTYVDSGYAGAVC